jgi:hypothetical protein
VIPDANGRWAVQIEMAMTCENSTLAVDEHQAIEL